MKTPNWVKAYSMIGILPIIFCTLLSGRSIFRIPVELGLMYYHYYFFHRFLHEYPEYTANLHVQVHHTKVYNIPRWLELTIDFIFEMVCFCLLPLAIGHLTKMWFCCPSVIIMISLTMTLGHIFNYSILGSNEIHQTHHKDVTVHFGPDFMDHLFETYKHDHEDGTMHIPPIIMATTITLLLKLYFPWND
jgi:hypothetical protein